MPVGAYSDGQASATIVILIIIYHTRVQYCTVHVCIMLVLATVKNACLSHYIAC